MKKREYTNQAKGIGALIVITFFYASLSVLARYLQTDFTFFQQVYLRVFVAIVLAMLVFYKYIRWQYLCKMPVREWMLLFFRGLTGYAIGVTLISKAATMTLLGNVAFISALPFVPLLGFIFFHEKITKWKVIFLLMALIGVSLLSVTDFRNLFHWGQGEVYAIIATGGFALSYVSRKWHTQYLNNQEITLMTFVFGTVQVFLLSLLFREGMPSLAISPLSWFVIFLGGVLNVLGLFLSNYAFEHVDAVRAGNLLNLEFIWALLFGLLLYHEWPSFLGLLGGVLIVVSTIGMNVSRTKNV